MKKLICTKCGNSKDFKKILQGNLAIEIVLWCFYLVPGLIYSIWRRSESNIKRQCDSCDSFDLIPIDTPKGKLLQKELSDSENSETENKEIEGETGEKPEKPLNSIENPKKVKKNPTDWKLIFRFLIKFLAIIFLIQSIVNFSVYSFPYNIFQIFFVITCLIIISPNSIRGYLKDSYKFSSWNINQNTAIIIITIFSFAIGFFLTPSETSITLININQIIHRKGIAQFGRLLIQLFYLFGVFVAVFFFQYARLLK